MQAANKITTIVATYMEKYSIRKAPIFLSYYVFTASIAHVSIRTFSLVLRETPPFAQLVHFSDLFP